MKGIYSHGRREVLMLAAALALASCNDGPIGPAVKAGAASFGTVVSTFPVVLLMEPGARSEVGAPVVHTLDDAVARVSPGGTIRVFPGTYTGNDVILTKGVVLEAAQGRPVLVGGAGAAYVLGLGDPSLDPSAPVPGPVTIRGLRFENPDGNHDIRVVGTYTTVHIEDVEFEVPVGERFEDLPLGSGIDVFEAEGNGVTVRNSVFRGGGIGVNVFAAPGVEVHDSEFIGQGHVAVHGEIAAVRNSRIDGCGPSACILVFSHNGEPFGDLQIIGNVVRPTGPLYNLITTDGGGGGRTTISGNTVVGAEGDTPRAQRNGGNGSGIEANNWGSATIEGNVVNTVFWGITVGNTGGVTASDNEIDDVHIGFFSWFNGVPFGPVAFRRNDVINYDLGADVGDPRVDLRCNWWGPGTALTGPTSMGVPDPSVYTPWATEPVANTAATGCGGEL